MANMARVGVNQPNSARIGLSLSRVGASREKKKKHVVGCGSTAGSDIPRVLLCWAASDAGAAPLAPCSCFPGFNVSPLLYRERKKNT